VGVPVSLPLNWEMALVMAKVFSISWNRLHWNFVWVPKATLLQIHGVVNDSKHIECISKTMWKDCHFLNKTATIEESQAGQGKHPSLICTAR